MKRVHLGRRRNVSKEESIESRPYSTLTRPIKLACAYIRGLTVNTGVRDEIKPPLVGFRVEKSTRVRHSRTIRCNVFLLELSDFLQEPRRCEVIFNVALYRSSPRIREGCSTTVTALFFFSLWDALTVLGNSLKLTSVVRIYRSSRLRCEGFPLPRPVKMQLSTPSRNPRGTSRPSRPMPGLTRGRPRTCRRLD